MESRQVELSGKLSRFRLIEIIQFLNVSGKTGELLLSNGSEAKAALFFEQGELVHVRTPGAEGRRAFEEAFCWAGGTFTFSGGVHSERRTIDIPVPSILLESQKRFLEIRSLNEKLPPEGAVFSLIANPQASPTFTTGEWEIIALIDGRRSLRQICERVEDEIRAKRAIISLLEQGLISAESSRSQFFNLTPLPVSAADFSGSRVFPSRVRTNLVLRSIDGRTTIEALRARLKIEDVDLVEDIKSLFADHWITFSRQEASIFLGLRAEL